MMVLVLFFFLFLRERYARQRQRGAQAYRSDQRTQVLSHNFPPSIFLPSRADGENHRLHHLLRVGGVPRGLGASYYLPYSLMRECEGKSIMATNFIFFGPPPCKTEAHRRRRCIIRPRRKFSSIIT